MRGRQWKPRISLAFGRTITQIIHFQNHNPNFKFDYIQSSVTLIILKYSMIWSSSWSNNIITTKRHSDHFNENKFSNHCFSKKVNPYFYLKLRNSRADNAENTCNVSKKEKAQKDNKPIKVTKEFHSILRIISTSKLDLKIICRTLPNTEFI
jgi:hypothetical protein